MEKHLKLLDKCCEERFKQACLTFENARKALEAAEAELHDAMQPHLKACETIDEYYDSAKL